MSGWALSAFLVVGGVVMSAVSGSVHPGPAHRNDFFLLYPLELLALPLVGLAAGRRLRARRDLAPELFGVGAYVLIVAGAVSTAFPIWLPSDNTILGSAVLAAVLAGVGTSLALSGAGVLAAWSNFRTGVIGAAGAMAAFVLAVMGGMIAPMSGLDIPLLLVAAVVIASLLVAWRERTRVVRPLAVALAGGACTVAVLLARGPGDWASASTSIKLYSFPIVVMALGISLAVLALAPRPPHDPPGKSTRA